MAILYKNDLEKVNQYSQLALASEIDDSQKIINLIETFLTTSVSSLKGDLWDTERKRLQVFVNVLKKRKQVASIILDSVKGANGIMLDYLNGFPGGGADMVDSSLVEELNTKIGRVEATIKELRESQPIINLIPEFEFVLSNLYKLLNYINELPKVDGQAYEKLGDAISNTTEYKSQVTGIY